MILRIPEKGEKLFACPCGKSFDTLTGMKRHVDSATCPRQGPERGGAAWIHWARTAGHRTLCPVEPMSEEKKAMLRAWAEEHKDEIKAKRRAKSELRRRMRAAVGGRR